MIGLSAGLWLARPALAADPPGELRLYVEGAYCAGCASELKEALLAGGVKNPSRIAPNRGKGYVIVLAQFDHRGDLAAVAKAVNAAQTPHRDQAPPGVALELFAKLDGPAAAAAGTALGQLKGVDAKRSRVDAARGTISVRLTGEGKLTVQEVIAALKSRGVDARIETGTSPTSEKPSQKPAKP